MKDDRDFDKIIERAKSRIDEYDDQADLPYAIFEEISNPYLRAATLVCSFPLSLTDDLVVQLLDFVSIKWPQVKLLGDMSSILIDRLRSSNFVINGSGERWRYEQKARQYFLRQAEKSDNFAKEIHKWLWNYYETNTSLFQNKRDDWSQKLHITYHQTPLDPKIGADNYVELFEDDSSKGIIFQERISTLVQEQADWLESYSIEVGFYQGMLNYMYGKEYNDKEFFQVAKGFFEKIHEHASELPSSDQINDRPNYYSNVATAKHLLGVIIEREPEHKDDILIEALYRNSLAINRKLEDKEYTAHVEKSLGDLLARRNDPKSLDEAETLLRQSLNYEEQDSNGFASIELSLGKLLFKRGRHHYDEAINRFKKGLEKARSPHLKIPLQLGLGQVLVAKGRDDWQTAKNAFNEAENLSRDYGKTRWELQALNEQLSLAIQEDDKSVQSSIRERLSKANLKYASELADSENWGDAIDATRQHIKFSEESGDVQAVARARVKLGWLYMKQNGFDSAKKEFEESLYIARQHHDQTTEAEAQLGLGNVSNKEGRWEAAIAHLQSSVEIFTLLGNVKGLAQSNTQLGEAYNGQSNFELALYKLKTSRESFEKINDIYEAAWVAKRIAEILDTQHRYSEALIQAQWGLEELLKSGHKDIYDIEQLINSLKRRYE